jgi:hypothetical protein
MRFASNVWSVLKHNENNVNSRVDISGSGNRQQSNLSSLKVS